ncbi:MAG TPA: CpaF/VirB11 family protein [Tissierellaceae bacterium]|nr:CpaF/VirB11 family protein [Tissierellaceae bacterium]
MLGKKRNNSVFLKEEKQQNVAFEDYSLAENETINVESIADTVKDSNVHDVNKQKMAILNVSERAIEMLEIQDVELIQDAEEVKRELGSEKRTHSLFFTPESEGRDFFLVLKDVQEYISTNYSILITDGTVKDSKEHLKRYISKYIQDSRISVKGMNSEELINALYSEMAEFGFLTKYIYGKGIEEIDINSWKDIEIQYSDGRCEKLEEHFDSPEHAINVIRRMLHISGMVLDNASPAVLGHLSKNIRIAVLKTPLVDEDVGIAASIRIVNPHNMKKEDFINGGTATDPMLDFLSECIRYGISVCVAGATSSGKTTIAGWLLTTIPDNKRIFTIENGSRELALVREKDGRVTNSVVHTITRDSENERQRIDQITLLDMSLRFNPDIIVVGEMRGAEANAAQEAARTGVAVLTTIHSNSCEATYRRMVSLCKRAVDMTDETLMGYVTEAYPIVVFCKQLENKERKLMEIMECEILPDGRRNYRPLFQYIITENRMEDGEFIIKGYHEQVNSISEGLSKRFLENGMPISIIEKLKKKEVQSI